MPAGRDQKIRLRVWLVSLAPIVAVAATGVYLMADKKPAARHAVQAIADETATPAPVPVPAPQAPQAGPVAAPSERAATTVVAPSPSASDAALREIDVLLARPPDSGRWTLNQKNAYRAKLVDELQRRQRTLEREIALAHRSGDTATEQTKTATLDYLRRHREALEGAMASPPPEAMADAAL